MKTRVFPLLYLLMFLFAVTSVLALGLLHTIQFQQAKLEQQSQRIVDLETFELTDPDDQCNDGDTPAFVRDSPACTGDASDPETESQPALHSAALR